MKALNYLKIIIAFLFFMGCLGYSLVPYFVIYHLISGPC